MVWLLLWGEIATSIYVFAPVNWLAIPWSPISVLGIAVSFFVGFKNNQCYDRMWKARKIWGAIVNDSRSWGSMTKGFIRNLHAESEHGEPQLQEAKKRLIHRHIAWLYTLRGQLLIPAKWEHVNQGMKIGKLNKKRQENWGSDVFKEFTDKIHIEPMISSEEFSKMSAFKNQATYLINQQSEDLKKHRKDGMIDDFRHMEMQSLLNLFYAHQGKCEHIKKFPLPRQYASMNLIFIGIFIFLMPFAMAGAFQQFGGVVT